jgi:hypothetical protein
MRTRNVIIPTMILLFMGSAVFADEAADKLAAQKKAAQDNWGQLEAGEAAVQETAHFLIYGPKAMDRQVKALGANLEKYNEQARRALGYEEKSEPWPGKLTVYLFSERDTFAAFVRRVEKKRLETEDASSLDVDGDQPHVAAGPSKNKKDASVEERAAEQVAAALLQRKAGKGVEIPAWLLHGFGRATSYRIAPKDAAVKKERALAAKWAPNCTAADVWGGKLNADEGPILEASLADYLAYGPTSARFPKFVTGFKPDENLVAKTPAQALETAGIPADSLDKGWRAWSASQR